MFDPDGLGHAGKDAIGKFFDEVISPNDQIKFEIRSSYECGSEVANVGTIDITLPGGSQVASVDLVSTYRVRPRAVRGAAGLLGRRSRCAAARRLVRRPAIAAPDRDGWSSGATAARDNPCSRHRRRRRQ